MRLGHERHHPGIHDPEALVGGLLVAILGGLLRKHENWTSAAASMAADPTTSHGPAPYRGFPSHPSDGRGSDHRLD